MIKLKKVTFNHAQSGIGIPTFIKDEFYDGIFTEHSWDKIEKWQAVEKHVRIIMYWQNNIRRLEDTTFIFRKELDLYI
jgi:hypothetical protein